MAITFTIAKGSAAETDSWLDSLRREGHLTSEEEAPLHKECMEIMAILTSKILQLERIEKERSSKVRERLATYELSEPLEEPSFPFALEDYL